MHFRANSHDVCCWKMFVPKPMSSKASKCQEFMTMFGHETSFEVESNKCCGTVAWCAVHTLQSFPAVFVLFMKYFSILGHNPLTWCCGVGLKLHEGDVAKAKHFSWKSCFMRPKTRRRDWIIKPIAANKDKKASSEVSAVIAFSTQWNSWDKTCLSKHIQRCIWNLNWEVKMKIIWK